MLREDLVQEREVAIVEMIAQEASVLRLRKGRRHAILLREVFHFAIESGPLLIRFAGAREVTHEDWLRAPVETHLVAESRIPHLTAAAERPVAIRFRFHRISSVHFWMDT